MVALREEKAEDSKDTLVVAQACRELFAQLRFSRYTFRLRWTSETLLPPYKGSTIRGALLNHFKQLVCPFNQAPCPSCLLRTNCHYTKLFERLPLQSLEGTTQQKESLPFVLTAPTEKRRLFEAGEEITFGITLLEDAIAALPFLICAIQRMGEHGLGSGIKNGMGRFVLEEAVEQHLDGTTHSMYSQEAPVVKASQAPMTGAMLPFESEGLVDVRMRLVTPLRTQSDKVMIEQLDFPVLIRLIARRLRLLMRDHTTQQGCDSIKYFVQYSKQTSTYVNGHTLYWYDWSRYSNRQQKSMNLGGLLGEIDFYQMPRMYLWFLTLGQHLHLGKNASFGLGRYELEQL